MAHSTIDAEEAESDTRIRLEYAVHARDARRVEFCVAYAPCIMQRLEAVRQRKAGNERFEAGPPILRSMRRRWRRVDIKVERRQGREASSNSSALSRNCCCSRSSDIPTRARRCNKQRRPQHQQQAPPREPSLPELQMTDEPTQ